MRALAMKPEIMLFDEPASALDPTMVDEVFNDPKRDTTRSFIKSYRVFERQIDVRGFTKEVRYERMPEQNRVIALL